MHFEPTLEIIQDWFSAGAATLHLNKGTYENPDLSTCNPDLNCSRGCAFKRLELFKGSGEG